MENTYFSMSIGTGCGVFFIDTPDVERVKHEIDNLPEGWTANIWLINGDGTPIRKCDPAEFKDANIVTVTESEPVINKWISEAVDQIESKTGVKMDSADVLAQLTDCEWIFGIVVDKETIRIDMDKARKQLDYIIERNIKFISDEMEEE